MGTDLWSGLHSPALMEVLLEGQAHIDRILASTLH
jgi:hypothetical protein